MQIIVALVERYHPPALHGAFVWGRLGSSAYPILAGVILGALIGAFSTKRWRTNLLATLLIASGLLFLQWMRMRAIAHQMDACMSNREMIRSAALAYRTDHKTEACSLDQLLSEGYIRCRPTCPVTGSDDYTLQPCDCGGEVYCLHASLY